MRTSVTRPLSSSLKHHGRHFVFGDIHGQLQAFSALLAHLQPDRYDTITLLGDVIDCGPDSRGVLDTILALERTQGITVRGVLGNHEIFMLGSREDPAVLSAWLHYGGDATLRSFHATSPDDIPREYYDLLLRFKPWIEDAHHIFVHGGVDPALPMSAQSETTLHWEHQRSPLRHYSGKRVIHGHSPIPLPQVSAGSVNLDTGIAHGGWLTCLELGSYESDKAELRRSDASITDRFWQADASGNVRLAPQPKPEKDDIYHETARYPAVSICKYTESHHKSDGLQSDDHYTACCHSSANKILFSR